MNRIKNILVPVDFSSTTGLILKQGARLASWNEATLHVFHVIEPDALERFERGGGEHGSGSLESRARGLMDECLHDADLGGVSVEQAIATGRPAERIVERANKLGVDLVILSAHDIGRKSHGRVVSKVVSHANCKVLIARDWQPLPFRRIGACVDFSDFSREVLEQAVHVALLDWAILEMIHVLYPIDRCYEVYRMDFGTKTRAEYRVGVRKWLTWRIETLTAPLQADLDSLEFTTVILESPNPADAITSHLRSNDLDLAVLGIGHRSHLGLRSKSIAEHLVHDTHCSVLAVKPQGKSKKGAKDRESRTRVA